MNLLSFFRGKPAATFPATPVTAAASPLSTLNSQPPQNLARILRRQADSRWMLPSLAAITPQYVEMVLRGALAGSHVQQWELFDLMLDSWPELAACAQELTCGVAKKKIVFAPWQEEDESAEDEASARCKLVSAALRGMAPNAANDENDLDGTVADLVDGWFRGVSVLELEWTRGTGRALAGSIVPRTTFWVHPSSFAWDENGTLGLRTAAASSSQLSTLNSQPSATSAFPEHKFLIGIHKAKSGCALGGAILRPLAWWWCAANFSADWLLNLAQLFGIPFRWANYDRNAPQAVIDSICTMMQNMGSAGYGAFPDGTQMNFLDAKANGDHSPQGELLDRADRYARLLILGQTLSGGQSASRGGGKAFGAVEADVKLTRIEAAAKYVAGILNTQLIPAILALNYGDTDLAPVVRFLDDEEGSLDKAQTLQTLAAAGVKIGQDYARNLFSIPTPEEEEETFGGVPPAPVPADSTTKGTKDAKDLPEKTDALAAKLGAIAGLEDDALFARELAALAEATE